MKQIIITLILLLFRLEAFSQDNARIKKILIVATNKGTLGDKANGTFLMEIVFPFQYFINMGYAVDIMTPKGGFVAIYDMGFNTPEMKKIQESNLFVAKTKNSLSPMEIKDSDYVAVYYPGGYGQFFDVVNDESISFLVAKIYENGGVIGAAGHGVASLTNIKLTNNKYLVEGKKLTCFPWSTEVKGMSISHYGKLLPFNMEEVLTKRGSKLIVCPFGTTPKKDCSSIVDNKNRIVTGSSAYEAQWVAEQMVELLLQTKK